MTDFSVVKNNLTDNSNVVTPSGTHKIDTPARRRHNLNLALELAAAGIYVFPTVDKNPVIEGWTKPDAEVEQVDGEFRGATRDPARIKKMWRRWPDATPSVSCGPSNVVVLDADTKKEGPAKLTQWLADNNIDISQYPVTHTRSGGLHIYLPNDQALGCSAGMFKDLGTDVRAIGGQVVAPGAIREDGAAYTSDENHPALVDFDPSLAEAPPAIIEAIKSAPKNQIGTDKTLESELIETLKSEDWPDGETITDVGDGRYDLDILCAKDERLRTLLETGGNMSHSEARWHLASSLWAGYGDRFNVLDFAGIIDWLNNREGSPTAGAFGVFVADDKPGEGEFSYRSLARDFYRSENEWRVTDGSAFTAVEPENDNYDDGELPPEQQALKERRKKVAPVKTITALDLFDSPAFVPEWIVKGVLPTKVSAVLWGAPGSMKTSWLVSLGVSMATQTPWVNGETLRRGGFLLCAMETADHSTNIVRGFLKDCGAPRAPYPIEVHPEPLPLYEREGNQTANERKIIAIAQAFKEKYGVPCELIALDTLSRALMGGNENHAGDIAALVAAADRISRATGAAVVVLHHANKSGDEFRGSSAILGNFEGLIHAEMDANGLASITVQRLKGVRAGQKVSAKSTEIKIGEYADCSPLTTFVLKAPYGDALVPVSDIEADAPTFQTMTGAATAPVEESEMSQEESRLLDTLREIGPSFTVSQAVAAWNARHGRRHGTRSDSTMLRRLQKLSGAYVFLDQSQGRRLARWHLIGADGAEGTTPEPDVDTERARVNLLAEVADAEFGCLGETFREGQLRDAVNARLAKEGLRPMSAPQFTVAWALAQKEGRIKFAVQGRIKQLHEYRSAA